MIGEQKPGNACSRSTPSRFCREVPNLIFQSIKYAMAGKVEEIIIRIIICNGWRKCGNSDRKLSITSMVLHR